MCLALALSVFPIVGNAEVQDNGKMWFSTTADYTFNVKGYYNNNLLQTTYADRGYQTYLKVDGVETALSGFVNNGTTINVNGIDVTQNLSMVSGGNYVKIEYVLKNTTNVAKTISLASGADIMIDRNDHAPIYKLEGEKGLRMTDGGNSQFIFIGRNSYGVTDVDTFWFGYYSDWRSNKYNHYAGNSITGIDSGMAWSWKNRTIQPGETQKYSVLIGIGELNNPPTLNLNTNLKNIYYTGEYVPISGTVNDTDMNDIVYIRYAIDDGAEIQIPGSYKPNGVPKSFNSGFTIPSNLPAGVHNLKVWAVDDKGNMSNPATINFTVAKDTVPPTISHSVNPTTYTNGNVTIYVSATDNQSGVRRIQLPDGTWVNGSTATYTVTSNGSYTFKAEDNVGNVATRVVTINNIDKVSPTVPTFKTLNYNRTTNKIDIQFNESIDLESGIKGYSIAVDTNPNTVPDNIVDATTGLHSLIKAFTQDFYVHIKAIDNAGNVSAVNHTKVGIKEAQFKLNTEQPKVNTKIIFQ